MEIGQICAVCQRIDFLTLPCPVCRAALCTDHRLLQHLEPGKTTQCSGAIAERTTADQQGGQPLGDPQSSFTQLCSLDTCRTRDAAGAVCPDCRKYHCMVHRHAPDHSCSAVESNRAAEAARKSDIKAFIAASLGQSTATAQAAAAKPTVRKSSPAIELMKLKQQAKGDASVQQNARIYLRVRLPRESVNLNKAPQDLPLWFHKDWVVGKVIDRVAQMAGVRNTNNSSTAENERLSLLNDDGVALSPSSTLASLVSEKQISNGSTVTLERGLSDRPDQ
ncbi:hypothetical protein DFJ73DRAFT_823772 [Zopfochytrium polystomum]|nr:hypothetical protein DFJ73DRAFT_823772 [Zopfochytrium polystomum]